MKLKLLILFILFPTLIYAQWQWAQHYGGNSFNYQNDRPYSVSFDGINFYSVGLYGGPLYLPNDTLQSNGVNQIFITKFNPAGTPIWAKTLGGNYNQFLAYEYGTGEYDNYSNHIYVAGQIIGNVDFGGIMVPGSINNSDIFLAKMDLNGNYIWVKKGGGGGDDYAKQFINSNGNIYLTTQTESTAQFGSFNLVSGGGLVKYDSSGIVLDAKILFTASTSSLTNWLHIKFLETDLLFHGYFNTPSFQLDTFNLTNLGTSDAFLARADSNGNVKWVKQFGNAGADYIEDMAIRNNYLYTIGGFQDSINFGGTSLYNNGKDVFIAKFDSAGNTIWARNLFCTGATNSGNKIVVDDDGNTYVTGSFSGTASFGNFLLTTTNPSDMFLARYDSAGNCLGVQNFGQASGSCLATDNNGDVVVAGTFNNTVTIGSNTFTSYGGRDVFLAKSDAITGLEKPVRITSNQLIIYANPNAGKCNITVPDEFINEKYLELIVFDNAGKIIQKKILEMNDGTIKVDIESQAKGVYSITLGNGKKVYSGKMVVE